MKIHAVTIDTTDPQALAAWWSDALGLAVAHDYGMMVQLATTEALPPFQFQKVDDAPTQRNRVHVDFKVTDLDGETERLAGLGATVVRRIELPQIRYNTLTDPDGNTFDLIQE